MTTAATSLLGLALPVTGELSGTWGDTVNNSITALLDSAVAGTTTLSVDADVTLTTTTLAANQAREAVILWTAGGTVTRYITAPAQSKTYVVLNKTSSTQSIVIRGVGPTTGVTVLAGKQALVAWDGTDFVEVSSGYVDGPASSTDNAVARFDGTDGKTIQNSVVIIADTTGNMSGVGTLGVGAITTSGALVGAVSQDAFNTVSTTLNLGGAATTVNVGAATGTLTVANATLAAKAVTATAVTNSALTATRLVYSGTAGLEVDSANLTFNGTILTSTGFAGPLNGTVGATTANTGAFTTLSTTGAVTITGGTANGVAYLNGSKVLTTGSALTFDGVNLGLGVTPSAWYTAGNFKNFDIGAAGAISGRNTGIGIYSNAYLNSSVAPIYKTTASAQSYVMAADTGQHIWSIAPSGTAGTAITFTQAMTLDASGNLGIGTTSASGRLTVLRSLTGATDNVTEQVSVFNNATGVAGNQATIGFHLNNSDWGSAATIARISAVLENGTTGATALAFGTAVNGASATAPERARIDSAGNLGLGVTPSAWALSGSAAMQIKNASFWGYANSAYVLSNGYTTSSGYINYIASDAVTLYKSGNGQHVWSTAPSGTAGNTATLTDFMTLDASGNLGIGTTSPGQKLEIAGNTKLLNYGKLQLANGINTTKWSIWDESVTGNDSLQFDSSSVTGALVLTQSGNLGLGVTPRTWSSGAISIDIGAYSSDYFRSAGFVGKASNAYYNSGWFYTSTNRAARYEMSVGDGSHAWFNAPSGTAGNAITFTQAMTLDASGNLIIGDTSTSSGLTLVRSGSTTAELKLNQTGTGGRDYRIGSTGSGYGTAGKLIFYDATAGAERMCIDSAGNLGLGVTPSAWNTGGAGPALQVNYASISQAGGFDVSNFATNAYLVSGVGYKYIGSAAATMYQQNAGAHAWFTAASGTAGNTITFTQAMTLTAGGVLLLGQTVAKTDEYLRVSGAGQASMLLDNTGKTNGAFVGVFNDAGVFGVNRNPATGIFYNTSNYAAEVVAVGSSSTSYILFGTAAAANTIPTERARIDSSGNLGLGTTTPATYGLITAQTYASTSAIPFYGLGNAAALSSIVLRNLYTRANGVLNGLEFRDSSNEVQAGMWANATGTNNQSSLVFGTNNGTGGNGLASLSERARIDSAGNLGLGVTPSAWQTGSYRAMQSGFGSVLVGQTDASVTNLGNNFYINSSFNYTYINTEAASRYEQYLGQHRWYSAPSGTAGTTATFTQAMTLDASGNLLVGTTSASNTPTQGVTLMMNTNVGSIGIGHLIGTSSGNGYANFAYNGAAIGSITQSGTTAVLYNLTSDQRLKENIQDAAPASALIDAIQVRQYNWKSDGSHQRYGFVAQELVTVAPEAVHQPADPEEMMAVDYSKLVPMLVKEIQDLRKRLAAAGI